MKRLLAAVMLIGVAVLVVVLTASGSSNSAARSAASVATKSVTFHLVEKSVGFNFIDNPPHQGLNAPPLSGDQFAITSDLLTKDRAHAGTLEATCTVTRGGQHQRGTCFGVFALKGGQIAGIALLTNSDVTRIAVTGGTGVYEGVSGSVTSVNKPNTPFADDTVHLIWP